MASDKANDIETSSAKVVDVNERTWLPRYCRGESECFELLLAAYKNPLYSYLLRSGFERSTCDDLFQDIFMKIHQYADRYQSSKPLKPWIFTIAVNTVRNHLRDTKDTEPDATNVESLHDEAPPLERTVGAEKELNRLECAIAALPAIQAEVIQLVVINELAQQDVATMLNIPVNTVKTHLRRARQTLTE